LVWNTISVSRVLVFSDDAADALLKKCAGMSTETGAVAPVASTSAKELRRVAFATYSGTALEWYDYFLYGTASALVFQELFFPTFDPVVGTILSLLTFAIGFVARPVGAVIFGHIGDRYGRRAALIATVTLMGVATGCIGLLPSYSSIGVAAPLILAFLRLLQGISAGGEWTGAALLAIEHAPVTKRGRYASFVQLGSPTGTILSSGGFALLALLPDEAFRTWAWRIPFLVAFVLLGLALWARAKVEESPLFVEALERNEEERLPVVETIRQAWGRLFIGAATYFVGVAGFFLLTTFMIGYITKTLGLSSGLALVATMAGAVLEVCVIVYFGRLADRIGAVRVCVLGAVVSILVSFPVFWLVDTKIAGLVILGVTIGIGAVSIPYAPVGVALASMFPARLRYSGVALSVGLCNIAGGFAPVAAAGVYAATGASWGPALLLAAFSAVTLVGALGVGRVVK
jgi:MFS family permease